MSDSETSILTPEQTARVPGTAQETAVPEAIAPDSLSAACGPEDSLSCLLETIQYLTAATELDEGYRGFAERLKKDLPYDTLGILLLDDLGRELHFVYSVGYPSEVTEHWRFGLGQGIVGIVAKTSRAVRVDDVREDSRYLKASPIVRAEVAVPLEAKGRTIGVLELGSSRPGFFRDEHERLLATLAGHLANAIETARLYENLRRQTRTLSVLHEVSRELTSILDRERLLERVAELIARRIDYDLFSVLLWKEESQLLESLFMRRADGQPPPPAYEMAMGHGICGTVAALRQPLRVPNVYREPRHVDCVGGIEVRSELAVPLVLRDRLIGVILLESERYDAFSQRQEQLLSTLSSSIAIALENARLYEKVQADERRLNRDLDTAREVQKQLLPVASPWLHGLRVAVAWEPARHLGGDFYDFLPYGEDRAAFALGDVAGKATSAALYGSLAVGTLREYAVTHRFEPVRVLEDMNGKLRQLGIDNRFLAMLFAVYHRPSRTLTLANSGLPHPFLLRDGKATPIEVEGTPLGLLPGRHYEQQTLELKTGDVVVMATDGIDECQNRQEEEFGHERVEATLEALAGGPAQEVVDGLIAAVDRHAAGNEPYDDRTVVALELVSESK